MQYPLRQLFAKRLEPVGQRRIPVVQLVNELVQGMGLHEEPARPSQLGLDNFPRSESVLRAKTASLPQYGLKEVVPSFPLFLESRRSDWHEGERRFGTDVARGASKPCRGGQLPLSAVTDQAQVHITVGPGVATGVGAEQIDRLKPHDLVERDEAFSNGVSVFAEAWRKVLEQLLHRANYSAGHAPP